MSSALLFILCFCLVVFRINSNDSKSDNRILVRRKRYVAFPEGASVSVAMCYTIPTLTSAPTIFSESINWGISYDLPNATFATQQLNKSKEVPQRRLRRDLYGKFELIMNSMGLDGRSCIFRSLCECEQRVFPSGKNIIEELFEIIFSRLCRYFPDFLYNEFTIPNRKFIDFITEQEGWDVKNVTAPDYFRLVNFHYLM